MRIGLLWHSLASGNLGVDALTTANLAIVRKQLAVRGVDAQFLVIGMRDNHDRATLPADVELLSMDTRTLVSPSGYWQALTSLDAIVDIGAGDSFAEIYGAKRFAFLWASKAMAIMRKVPLLLAPQTIGPFTRPAYIRLAAWVMNRAMAVVARDEASLAAARQIAPRSNAILATDVAFELPYEDRRGERGRTPMRIGVNASGLLFHQAETGRNRYGLSYDYAAFIRALLAELTSRDDCEVHLVVHATSADDPSDDDGALADRLVQEFPSAIHSGVFAGSSEAKSYLSSLDFLVAGRMHACIGAFSAGVPVVPTAYSRKFSGLFGLLGYPHIVPVEGMTTSEARDFVLDRLARQTELSTEIASGMSKTAEFLDQYKVQLQRLFEAAEARRACRR